MAVIASHRVPDLSTEAILAACGACVLASRATLSAVVVVADKRRVLEKARRRHLRLSGWKRVLRLAGA